LLIKSKFHIFLLRKNNSSKKNKIYVQNKKKSVIYIKPRRTQNILPKADILHIFCYYYINPLSASEDLNFWLLR